MEDCMLTPPEDLWPDNWLDDYDPFEDLTDDEVSLYRTDPQAGRRR